MPYNQLSYGSFSFPFSKLDVVQAACYADDKITQIGTMYTFTIHGYLTASTTSDFAMVLNNVKCQLSTPRLQLAIRWSDDNSTWNTFYSFETDDIAWGPMPSTVNLRKFSGGRAALYSWTCQVMTKQCFGSACSAFDRPSDVLAITRAWDFSIDANGFTTRTLSGKLTVTSNSAQIGKPADYFRYLVAPDEPVNFKRESQSFSSSEDGREMTYRIVDVEKMYTLPNNISSGMADYSLQIPLLGGLVHLSLSGYFEAPATTPKSLIIQRALNLIAVKIPAAVNGITVIPGEMTIKESVYGNRIDFNVTATAANGLEGDSFNIDKVPGIQLINVALPDGVSSGQALLIGPYGQEGTLTSGVTADAPFIYDACTPVFPDTGAGVSTGTYPTYGDNTPTVPGGPNPSQSNTGGISDGHKAAPYTAFHEQISFEVDNHIKVFIPKVSGVAPIIQQTGVPTMTVIQAGYAVRMGEPPVANDPYYDDSTATIISAFASVPTAEPIGQSDNFQYTIHWRYVMQYIKSIESGVSSGALDITYPDDPRLATPDQEVQAQFPELVEVST